MAQQVHLQGIPICPSGLRILFTNQYLHQSSLGFSTAFAEDDHNISAHIQIALDLMWPRSIYACSAKHRIIWVFNKLCEF